MPIPKNATLVQQIGEKGTYDKRSFRTITICPIDRRRRCRRIIIACPKGEWKPRKKKCKVGTQAYKTYMIPRKYAIATSKNIKGRI